MKLLNRKIFFLCLSLFSAAALQAQQPEQVIANEFLVLLKTGDAVERILLNENLFSRFSVERRISVSPNIYWLHSSTADDNASLELLRKANGIILAQKNHETELRAIPNDTMFASQWNMNNTGQTGNPDVDIDAPEAWDIATGGLTVQGDTIVVAVIDCGADLAHDDLNFWKNYLEIPGDSIDNDTNGYVDDFDGWNAFSQTGSITQSCNHGTHVAGIIGARGNNTTGVAGVNWNVKIMPVQPSSPNEALVVGAYTYIYNMRKLYNQTNGAKGAFVVATNSSFGVNNGQPANFPLWCAMYDSMGSVGILNAGAGPNFNTDVDQNGDIPTACPSGWLISVTNTNSFDALQPNTGYGDTTIDLGAPGVAIFSTYAGNTYSVSTGTSMSTPHVAGAVALMWAAACTEMVNNYRLDPAGTALVMKQLLLESVDTLASLTGITVSNGRLNLYKSLLSVQNYCQDISVEENEEHFPVLIFPNPATNEFTIYGLRSTISKIEVYDVMGQNFFSQHQTSNVKRQTINVSSWSRGVYFVKCFSGEKFFCAKVILN